HQLVNKPVVKRAVYFKFQSTDGVGNSFLVVALTMGKIVHGIHAPFVAGTVVMRFQNAIDYGVAHMHVGRCHIDFCPQYPRSFIEFAGCHPLEQTEIFFGSTVSVWAFLSRTCWSAFLLTDGY